MSSAFPGRTGGRKLIFSVASLLLLPILMIAVPIFSPGPFLYGLTAFWVFCAVATLLPYAHTVYRIEDGRLIYHSGLRWSSVPVDRIHSITYSTTTLVSDASASFTGLRIRFFTGEVFIAPKQEDQFIHELRRINPGIVVRDARS